MIKNEIFSSKDIPDEQHEEFINFYDDILEALTDVALKHHSKDDRIFLSALTLVHAGFLAIMVNELEGQIDEVDYLAKDIEVFRLNFTRFLTRLKEMRDQNEQ